MIATCSNCNKETVVNGDDNGFGYDYNYLKYCPHCGAKMDLEDGEDDEDDEILI